MPKNLVLLEKEDLREIIFEILEKMIEKDQWVENTLPNDGDYLTRDEVCSRLRITPTTLWRLEKRGEIKAHRIGRRCLYSRKDVDFLVGG